MSFTQAIAFGFSRYFNFSGRAARSEFWFWILFVSLGGLIAKFLDYAIGASSEPFSALWSLATFIPNLAIAVRRLHDIDRSGWWLLLFASPLAGVAVLFVVPSLGFIVMLAILVGISVLIGWSCYVGTTGYNRFGPDPFGSGGHIAPPLTAADQVREQAWRRRASR
jgi:uncharacterized membrane protein YhaH (DUF805 family)